MKLVELLEAGQKIFIKIDHVNATRISIVYPYKLHAFLRVSSA